MSAAAADRTAGSDLLSRLYEPIEQHVPSDDEVMANYARLTTVYDPLKPPADDATLREAVVIGVRPDLEGRRWREQIMRLGRWCNLHRTRIDADQLTAYEKILLDWDFKKGAAKARVPVVGGKGIGCTGRYRRSRAKLAPWDFIKRRNSSRLGSTKDNEPVQTDYRRGGLFDLPRAGAPDASAKAPRRPASTVEKLPIEEPLRGQALHQPATYATNRGQRGSIAPLTKSHGPPQAPIPFGRSQTAQPPATTRPARTTNDRTPPEAFGGARGGQFGGSKGAGGTVSETAPANTSKTPERTPATPDRGTGAVGSRQAGRTTPVSGAGTHMPTPPDSIAEARKRRQERAAEKARIIAEEVRRAALGSGARKEHDDPKSFGLDRGAVAGTTTTPQTTTTPAKSDKRYIPFGQKARPNEPTTATILPDPTAGGDSSEQGKEKEKGKNIVFDPISKKYVPLPQVWTVASRGSPIARGQSDPVTYPQLPAQVMDDDDHDNQPLGDGYDENILYIDDDIFDSGLYYPGSGSTTILPRRQQKQRQEQRRKQKQTPVTQHSAGKDDRPSRAFPKTPEHRPGPSWTKGGSTAAVPFGITTPATVPGSSTAAVPFGITTPATVPGGSSSSTQDPKTHKAPGKSTISSSSSPTTSGPRIRTVKGRFGTEYVLTEFTLPASRPRNSSKKRKSGVAAPETRSAKAARVRGSGAGAGAGAKKVSFDLPEEAYDRESTLRNTRWRMLRSNHSASSDAASHQ